MGLKEPITFQKPRPNPDFNFPLVCFCRSSPLQISSVLSTSLAISEEAPANTLHKSSQPALHSSLGLKSGEVLLSSLQAKGEAEARIPSQVKEVRRFSLSSQAQIPKRSTEHHTSELGLKMTKSLFQKFGRAYLHLRFFPPSLPALSPIVQARDSIFFAPKYFSQVIPLNPLWNFRNLSHGSINLVTSQGKLKFETHEVDPPKKEKWKTKKRLKMQRKRAKKIRKEANKKDPRMLGIKGKKKKQRFANAAERIMYKLEKAKIKEGMLIQRLARYEVPKVQGPMVKPHNLTGEERFYLKKMAQKQSNYVPVGRRGVFGGVILNMHMHWKKHETVEVICKPCKPGQVQEYAQEIARLSGGIPIQIIGDDTIIFYRGKNYVQPQVMSPIDTLSKKRALEKSKYEQSLESVQRFIAISEKELELYYRHIALYGDPNDRNPLSVLEDPVKSTKESQTIGIHWKGNKNSDSGIMELSDKAPSEIEENQNLSLGSQSHSCQDYDSLYDFNDQERESLSIGSTCLSGNFLCNGTQKDI